MERVFTSHKINNKARIFKIVHRTSHVHCFSNLNYCSFLFHQPHRLYICYFLCLKGFPSLIHFANCFISGFYSNRPVLTALLFPCCRLVPSHCVITWCKEPLLLCKHLILNIFKIQTKYRTIILLLFLTKLIIP